MAPEPRTTSTRGKARVYMCLPCGKRHEAPTGGACARQGPPTRKARSTAKPTRGLARPASQAKASAAETRCPGRPPKIVPLPITDDDESETDVETLPLAPRGLQKRARSPDVPTEEPLPKRRPVPKPSLARPTTSTAPSVSDADTALHTHDEALVQVLLAQMTSIQKENREERDRMAVEHRADRETLQNSIATINACVESLVSASRLQEQARPMQPTLPDLTPPTPTRPVDQAPPGLPNIQSPPAAPVIDPPGPTIVGSRDHLFPNGQRAVGNTTPELLEQSNNPAKTLRSDEPTASVAKEILRVVGILHDLPGKKDNKSGYPKLRKKIAKCPSDYVCRL